MRYEVSWDYLVIDTGVVEAIKVGLVAVLIPPTPPIGHGAAGDERRGVSVSGREHAPVVVTHRVTYRDEKGEKERGKGRSSGKTDGRREEGKTVGVE